MIDPAHSLSFSIQANPGIYAVLVGSGASRSSKIPTGWDITVDLVRKLSTIHEETCDPTPEHWYLNKFGKELNYSDLLDELAKTPAERQQLLRGYWEPTDQEREEGEKQPSAAHRAIASLAARGYIRVILTTNCDRLMETALTDEGVVPTILSSPDQVQGALPLIHTECCVFKLHGDYLDTRIRNTPAELDQYPPEFDRLLGRVFDEFGLVVCGWSAEWDGALRNALYRAPSRRFTTYWAAQGKPGDQAQRLIDHRRAQVITIEDADTFFQTIQQSVQSIEEFSRPHPLSTEAAVASLKRYISEPRYRIKLSDLVDTSIDRVLEIISGDAFAVHGGPEPTTESVTVRVRSYEAACSTLFAMSTVGSYWTEEHHYPGWQRALGRLGSRTSSTGPTMWVELQRYPATLLLYALGLGAVEADRLQFLKCILDTAIRGEHREDVSAVEIFSPSCQFQSFQRPHQVMQCLEGMDKHYTPLNDWIHTTLRPYCKRIIPDDNRYTLVFDKLEILMALSFRDKKSWVPAGSFGWRVANRDRILQEIEESISTRQDSSPFVMYGICGDNTQNCKQVLASFKDSVERWPWY